MGGTCTHNFDILNNSSCPPTTSIFVSVVASNVFGSSPLSTPLVKGMYIATVFQEWHTCVTIHMQKALIILLM